MLASRYALLFLWVSACGVQGSPFLDGDRPILILDSPWPDAASFAQSQWNPAPAGGQQVVHCLCEALSFKFLRVVDATPTRGLRQ